MFIHMGTQYVAFCIFNCVENAAMGLVAYLQFAGLHLGRICSLDI